MDTGAYDDYIAALFAPQDTVLSETIARMDEEKIPRINVSPVEGKLLQLLAFSIGAKRVLEIGTLGGYSGIHFARALPDDGKLITLEISERHADFARENFERIGLGHKVEVRLGPALESIRQLADSAEPQFDIIFIDADKDGYVEYLHACLPLLREGGLLLADNTLPESVLTDEASGPKLYNTAVSESPELTSTIIPVFRGRGMDGLTVSIKRTSPVEGR